MGATEVRDYYQDGLMAQLEKDLEKNFESLKVHMDRYET